MALLQKLLDLRITPVRFDLEARSTLRTPEYKGALLRGGFGYFYRNMMCTTGAPSCEGCPHLTSCAYSVVFETPTAKDESSPLKKVPHAPHPFIMVPPLDGRSSIPEGAHQFVDITFIGAGVSHLPDFIRVFEAMGASGKFGGAFKVSGVRSLTGAKPLLYDGRTRRTLASPIPWTPERIVRDFRRVHLQFLTPLRMRTRGDYNSNPAFGDVAQSLIGRLHLLSMVHGSGSADREWTRSLLRQADFVVTEQRHFMPFEWGHTSGSQARRVRYDGVVGALSARGELGELVLALQAGELLNIGSNTSMGLGKFRAIFEE